MAKIDFLDIFQELKHATELLAEEKINEYKMQAIGDAEQFLDKSKERLKKWTVQLAEGDLTADDFAWLVKGEKDLAEMNLLKQAGVALVRIDEFKAGLLDLIVKTVVSKVL